ncbi:MAG: hypothetical protein U0P45_09250 [Acidimicrobiales bacterium]
MSHSDLALPARRMYVVDQEQVRGVVVEVDATTTPAALAVLQAGLQELPDGTNLVHGYRWSAAGLGAWVADRRLRVAIWPALLHADGSIEADDPDDPDADVLVIDIDPREHAGPLASLVEMGRLFVAGPDAGPTPLVLDVDTELLVEVLASVVENG